jgi:hypothetical protein
MVPGLAAAAVAAAGFVGFVDFGRCFEQPGIYPRPFLIVQRESLVWVLEKKGHSGSTARYSKFSPL